MSLNLRSLMNSQATQRSKDLAVVNQTKYDLKAEIESYKQNSHKYFKVD